VIERTGYRAYLQNEFEDGDERWSNALELITVAEEYSELAGEDALVAVLEDIALIADVDTVQDDESAVTLITLHAAKGLEFPVVFMLGMEEGVLPHIRSFDDPEQMEEERRLCYVGITRAKQRLYLVRAFRRALMGMSTTNPPSRFLRDVPENLVHFLSRREDERNAARIGALPGRERAARMAATPAPIAVPSDPAFAPGDHVRHEKFGEGLVVSCTLARDDQEVTVAFKGGVGVKKLLLSLANLRKV
jgi:DNA helicase-2/ATP-dependent DNA helicase PcrA